MTLSEILPDERVRIARNEGTCRVPIHAEQHRVFSSRVGAMLRPGCGKKFFFLKKFWNDNHQPEFPLIADRIAAGENIAPPSRANK